MTNTDGINSVYRFFFHPFSEEHSLPVKVLSVITVVALSVLTAGIYFIVFLRENGKSPFVEKTVVPEQPLGPVSGFVGIQELKRKQADHLLKLQALAKRGQWEHLREHTLHRDSGFDWWMFPIDRTSQGQGDKYKLGPKDVELLKADPEFMESYRTGVKLVLCSWGWDAFSNSSIQNNEQRWTGYQVRLGKMVHSLLLFEERELLESVKQFCEEQEIALLPQIQKYLPAYLVERFSTL